MFHNMHFDNRLLHCIFFYWKNISYWTFYLNICGLSLLFQNVYYGTDLKHFFIEIVKNFYVEFLDTSMLFRNLLFTLVLNIDDWINFYLCLRNICLLSFLIRLSKIFPSKYYSCQRHFCIHHFIISDIRKTPPVL